MPEAVLRASSKLPLSLDEARRAFYLDVEGPRNGPPSFVGLRYDEDDGCPRFEQIILEGVLRPVLALERPLFHHWPSAFTQPEGRVGKHRHVVPSRSAATLASFLTDLAHRAQQEDRLIVSWSSYDAVIISSAGDVSPDLRRSLLSLWRDAKRTCKKWRRQVLPDQPVTAGHHLKEYLRHVGYDVPTHLGILQASARIAAVRTQLARKEDANALTPVAKAKWTKVLDYNWHDCNGLRELTLIAASGLASCHKTPIEAGS